MYAALWRALPGPRWARVVQLVLLAALVVAVCFTWVFPWVSAHLPFADNTVGAAASAPLPLVSKGPS